MGLPRKPKRGIVDGHCERLRRAAGTDDSFGQWLLHKPVPSGALRTLPIWLRTSSRVTVNRSCCCPRR